MVRLRFGVMIPILRRCVSGGGLKLPFPCDGPLDVLRRDNAFFEDSVRKNDRFAPMKEIEDAVIDSLQGGAEFVNAIPQKSASGRRSSWPISRSRSIRATHLSRALSGMLSNQASSGTLPSSSR